MKLSYAVTVKDEIEEIQRLIPFLLENKRDEDEIVVLWDDKGSKEVENYLREIEGVNCNWFAFDFKNDFSELKNELTSFCDGDFIFQIDADEIPNEYLIKSLPILLKYNTGVDVYLVPRENYVNGITQEHINKWRWNVDEKQRINWPDLQWRIYRNNNSIVWVNCVHERLDGFKAYANLPLETEWSLNHTKSIQKQEKQNNYYNTL